MNPYEPPQAEVEKGEPKAKPHIVKRLASRAALFVADVMVLSVLLVVIDFVLIVISLSRGSIVPED